MRLFYHKIHFLITGTILLLSACEKDELELTLSDGVLKGTTTYYQTVNPYDGPFPLDNVTIRAIGPYGTKTALTNANGEYEIIGLGNGTYEIEFLKKGWGATKYYSVQIYGNETVNYNKRMWKYPEFAMPVLDSKGEEYQQGYVAFHSNVPESTDEIPHLRAFFSKTRDVSCFKYDHTDEGYYYTTTDHVVYYFELISKLYDKSVFIIVYLIDDNDYGEYDAYRAVKVFPSINPEKHSQVIEYKIP